MADLIFKAVRPNHVRLDDDLIRIEKNYNPLFEKRLDGMGRISVYLDIDEYRSTIYHVELQFISRHGYLSLLFLSQAIQNFEYFLYKDALIINREYFYYRVEIMEGYKELGKSAEEMISSTISQRSRLYRLIKEER
jgi:hypothetical protein